MRTLTTALLTLFLVLPVRGDDGCRGRAFKCGDKCVSDIRTCKCGEDKFEKYEFKWCCHNETCGGEVTFAATWDVSCPGGTMVSLDKPCLAGVNERRCPADAGITRGDALSKQCSARKETKKDTENKDKNLLILGLSVGAGIIFAISVVIFAVCFYLSRRCATYIKIYS